MKHRLRWFTNISGDGDRAFCYCECGWVVSNLRDPRRAQMLEAYEHVLDIISPADPPPPPSRSCLVEGCECVNYEPGMQRWDEKVRGQVCSTCNHVESLHTTWEVVR